MKIIVSQEEISQIETMLENYLQQFYTDLDFSKGSPLNDILVQGFKVPVALLNSIATRNREMRSLSGLQRLLDAVNSADPTDPEIVSAQADIQSAVLDVLSNWYITRQGGSRSRGLINLHFTSNPSIIIPAAFKANRGGTLVFMHTAASDVIISPTDYQVIKDSSGTVLEYVYRIMVECTISGDVGEVQSGTWESFDQISPFLYKVTSDFSFSRGAGAETTQQLLSRAREGGVTERTLHNQRALQARFAEEFPDYLPIRSIGAGDLEMHRDLLDLGSNLKIHRLNHWNIYIAGNIEESKIYSASTGPSFTSPRTGAVIVGEDNKIILPSEPILNIREIRWLNDGSDPRFDSYTDADGYMRIELLSRYSTDSSGSEVLTEFTDLPQAYIEPVDMASVYYWGTNLQTHWLTLNPALFQVRGITVEIVYDTIQGFSVIHDFIRNTDNRPGAGDPLVYAYYPAIVSFDLRYKKSVTAATSVDLADAKTTLTSFVRSQKSGNQLFASEIMREFMDNYGDLSAGVYPITLQYRVILPNGGILSYSSQDGVSLDDTSKLVAGSYTPSFDIAELQVSDRTMAVFTDETNVNIIEEA